MKRIPFSPSELEVIGGFPTERPGAKPTGMLRTPITPRENWKAFIQGKKPHWIPHQAERTHFHPDIIADNTARGFVAQKIPFDQSKAGGKDAFGVDWVFDPVINGATPRPGVMLVPDLEEWEKYVAFPDLDKLDWAGCAETNLDWLRCGSFSAFAVFNGLFERLWALADMNVALIALLDEDLQEAVHRLFDRLCVYYDDLFAHVEKWFGCDSVWFHDDWGSQTGPLFSPDTCEEMLLPYLKRVVDSAHGHGLAFEFHSCGRNELLVPLMIEAGVDLWAGQEINDKAALYKRYGQQIKLGVEPRPIPPDAGEQQVRDEIRRLLDIYRDGNFFIARHRGMHPLEYPVFYEETRRHLGG